MARDQAHRKNWFSLVLSIFALMLAVIRSLDAAERIHTAYFSPPLEPHRSSGWPKRHKALGRLPILPCA